MGECELEELNGMVHVARLCLVVVAAFIAVIVALAGYFLRTGREEANQTGKPSSQENATTDYGNIRSVTFYVFPFDEETYYQELERSLPKIKATGFNTIWIVNPWAEFNPKPLAKPTVYNTARFEHLRKVLGLLRANGMEAILGLNYLGKGWSPEGIDPGKWITNRTMYDAFEAYITEFLERIQDFHDMVYILLFTEGTEPEGLDPYRDARVHAGYLRKTLGSLPSRLDPKLRAKFRIGYHDYSLINLDWAEGDSPIETADTFDFLSMVFYEWEGRTDQEIAAELERRAGFFKALYPETPLIVGELGASICEHGLENQARVIAAKISSALNQGYGFNLWHWRPIPDEDKCGNPAFRGLAIRNEDGSDKPAVEAVRSVLAEQDR